MCSHFGDDAPQEIGFELRAQDLPLSQNPRVSASLS